MNAMMILLPLALVAGCVDDGRPGRPLPISECRAGPAQRFVGAQFRPALARQAQRISGARSVRVVQPGQAVTMDFRQDRLNVEIGESGRVRAIRCG